MLSNNKTLQNDIDIIFDFIKNDKKYFLLLSVKFLDISLGEEYINGDRCTMSITSCVTDIGYFEGLMFRCFSGVMSGRLLLSTCDYPNEHGESLFLRKNNRYLLFLTNDKKEFIKLKLRCKNQIFSGER